MITAHPSASGTRPIEVFVSYSHLNTVWFDRLKPVLRFAGTHLPARAWHDQELRAGDRWDVEIQAALGRMEVYIGLISYEFLASDYIVDIELKQALARQKKQEVEIIPILLYETNLQEDCPELHGIQPLPALNRCWRDYERNGGHYQDAHKPIRDGLRAAIEKARARRP